MSHYFLAANLWLALAVLAFVGRTYERSGPTMYTVFGVGRSFYTHEYNLLVGGLVAIAAGCFLVHVRTTRGGKL